MIDVLVNYYMTRDKSVSGLTKYHHHQTLHLGLQDQYFP